MAVVGVAEAATHPQAARAWTGKISVPGVKSCQNSARKGTGLLPTNAARPAAGSVLIPESSWPVVPPAAHALRCLHLWACPGMRQQAHGRKVVHAVALANGSRAQLDMHMAEHCAPGSAGAVRLVFLPVGGRPVGAAASPSSAAAPPVDGRRMHSIRQHQAKAECSATLQFEASNLPFLPQPCLLPPAAAPC